MHSMQGCRPAIEKGPVTSPEVIWGTCGSVAQHQLCFRHTSSSSTMNADTMVSADSTARPPCCHMQAVSHATKMLQTCSPISQCIQDGQLSKAQQMLERANSQWRPASKPASEISRCCCLPNTVRNPNTACITLLQHKASQISSVKRLSSALPSKCCACCVTGCFSDLHVFFQASPYL